MKQLCEEGHHFLDPVRLGRDQHDLRKCLEGLKWTMINHSVEAQFPRTPHIFQKALNIEHHIGDLKHMWKSVMLIPQACQLGPSCHKFFSDILDEFPGLIKTLNSPGAASV